MIRSTIVVALIALTSAVVSATFMDKCPNAGSACKATAVAAAQATSFGGGQCTVTAQANAFCGVFRKDLPTCFVADSSFYDGDGCRARDIDVDIRCWLDLAAVAFASAFTRADCDGKSFGCGFAAAAAESESQSVGCFVVQSLLDVAQALNTNTRECQVQLGKVVDAVASAAARARAAACSSGGVPGFDADIDFDVSVREVVATAFGTCWTYCP